MIITLSSKHFNISFDDRPDNAVVHCWVLMRQLVAEVDDSPSMADGTEDLIG